MRINAFERTLVENSTTVLKFMLHIIQRRNGESVCNRGSTSLRVGGSRADAAQMLDGRDALARHSRGSQMGAHTAVASIVCETLETMSPQYPKPDWERKDFKVG
jgi:hypothetical protein